MHVTYFSFSARFVPNNVNKSYYIRCTVRSRKMAYSAPNEKREQNTSYLRKSPRTHSALTYVKSILFTSFGQSFEGVTYSNREGF